jgi:hypothetical protein
MINKFAIGLFALGCVTFAAPAAMAQQVDCRFFRVAAERLNVFTQARADATFLGTINRDDMVCVAGDQQAGDQKWAYVAYQMLGGDQRKSLDGWAIMSALRPASPDEVAAVRNSAPQREPPREAMRPAGPPPSAAPSLSPREAMRPPEPPPSMAPSPPAREAMRPPEPPMQPAPAPVTPAPPAESGQSALADQIVRFDQPIKGSAYPVDGNSLQQLVQGVPEFPPIEGLPEDVWKKTCNNCHQWNRQSLCVQAKIYATDPKMAFRKQHPYGGPEKTAMMNWAEHGCQ